jgi:hypothetical protein
MTSILSKRSKVYQVPQSCISVLMKIAIKMTLVPSCRSMQFVSTSAEEHALSRSNYVSLASLGLERLLSFLITSMQRENSHTKITKETKVIQVQDPLSLGQGQVRISTSRQKRKKEKTKRVGKSQTSKS